MKLRRWNWWWKGNVRLTTVKTQGCGDNRKHFSPPSRNMSEPVMSLPVSYEMKACHYHDSIILTLQVKLQGAPKGAPCRGHKIIIRIPSNFQIYCLLYVCVFHRISKWERDMINYISIHIKPESFQAVPMWSPCQRKNPLLAAKVLHWLPQERSRGRMKRCHM